MNSKLCTYSNLLFQYSMFMAWINLSEMQILCWIETWEGIGKFAGGLLCLEPFFFLFLYSNSTFSVPKYGDKEFPESAIICGILLVVFSLIQVPIGGIYSFFKSESSSFVSKFWDLTKPTKNWGPLDDKVRNDWLEHCKMTTPSVDETQSLTNNATTDQTSN